MRPQPTGQLSGTNLRLKRRLAMPIEDVWAAITESDRLARWIGYFEGDPATGSVQLFMTAEADEPPAQEVRIDRCEAPTVLAVTQGADAMWRLRVELEADGDETVVTLLHLDINPDMLPMVGPGWEYYLDRLVAAETGQDVDAIDFDKDYYPAMETYYSALAILG